MMLKNGLLPGAAFDVGVYFGCEDAFVAEHFLDGAEVGTMLDEMGGERMAEGVGRNFLVNAGGHCLALDHLEYIDPAQASAVAVQKKDVFVCASVRFGTAPEIFQHGIRSHFSERHYPLLVALSSHPDK